jgi:cell division cycle protein 20 (cofactor of APC complex)
MANTSINLTDFESMMALDNPIKSQPTRWERKAQQQMSGSDRYIPNRSGTDFEKSNALNNENNDKTDDSEHTKLLLANTKDRIDGKKTRVLAFKNKAPAPIDGYQNSLKVLYSTQGVKKEIVKSTRQISSAPVRILDAPDMLDDYCMSFVSLYF